MNADTRSDMPATEIGGYRLERLIHEAEGVRLYRAESPTGGSVAVKTVEPGGEPTRVLRLYQAGRQAIALDHPLVSRVECVDCDGDLHYQVLPYASGGALTKHLAGGEAAPIGLLVRTVSLIASGLDAIHAAGIVHRALTPEHVLFGMDGQPKLIGLGYATNPNTTGDYYRTPTSDWAICPRVIADPKSATIASDVYSLGALLTGLLCRAAPAAAATPDWVDEALGPRAAGPEAGAIAELLPLLKQSLAEDPAERPDSAWSFAERASRAVGRDALRDWPMPPLVTGNGGKASQPWYVLRPVAGGLQLVKGPRRAVTRWLHRGKLTGREYCCQTRTGVFRPLAETPEFAAACRSVADAFPRA